MKWKQIHRHRIQTSGCQGGEGWESDKVGDWGQQIQADIWDE